MSRLGYILVVAVVVGMCWHGLTVAARAERQYEEMSALAAAQDERLQELEQRVIEADTLMLAARVVSDDLVTRAQQTARATGVPMWDFACAERGEN